MVLTEKSCPEMSFFFITAAGINLAAFIILFVRIFFDFKSSGENSYLLYHRSRVRSIFDESTKSASYENLMCLISLHLFVPFTGFAFFLKSDANFLVLIVSVLWSIQLFQRLYPGIRPD
ncbi:MAG: hypothetical protein OEZ34_15700 [Spirochaetia bacterium]|nr:hypothetical protein [Spirochaetia bacterium]